MNKGDVKCVGLVALYAELAGRWSLRQEMRDHRNSRAQDRADPGQRERLSHPCRLATPLRTGLCRDDGPGLVSPARTVGADEHDRSQSWCIAVLPQSGHHGGMTGFHGYVGLQARGLIALPLSLIHI